LSKDIVDMVSTKRPISFSSNTILSKKIAQSTSLMQFPTIIRNYRVLFNRSQLLTLIKLYAKNYANH